MRSSLLAQQWCYAWLDAASRAIAHRWTRTATAPGHDPRARRDPVLDASIVPFGVEHATRTKDDCIDALRSELAERS